MKFVNQYAFSVLKKFFCSLTNNLSSFYDSSVEPLLSKIELRKAEAYNLHYEIFYILK